MAQLVPPSPRLPRPSGYGTARDLAAFDGELVNSLQRELSEHARRLNGALMADGSEPFNGNMDINGTLHATGAVDFDNNVNVDGTLNVEGAATIDDNLDVSGNLTVTGTIGTVSTFTPSLTFGGGATGMTYSVRTGHYIRYGAGTGGLVTGWIDIGLSAIGSSTGVAAITGLPVAMNVQKRCAVRWAYWGAFAAMAGHPTGLGVNSQLDLYTGGGATGISSMTHANFANGCRFLVDFTYGT